MVVLKSQIDDLEKSPSMLDAVVDEAIKILTKIVKRNPVHSADIDSAFKSSVLDQDITRSLHKGGGKKRE